MAKSEIMIRGRIGNMIFYRVRGVTRIRSVPLSTGKPDSSKCRPARLRLIAAVRFYQRLQDSRFRDIWRMAAKDTAINGYNLFVKQNIHVFNDRTLFDPVRLQLVFGALPPMNCLELSEQTGRRIVLTWKNSLEPAGIREWWPCVKGECIRPFGWIRLQTVGRSKGRPLNWMICRRGRSTCIVFSFRQTGRLILPAVICVFI